MARPLRIEYAGAVYHVTSRGDRREAIYLDDVDPEKWLEIFGSVCERYNWLCHAWLQMDNHYHLMVETVDGNLSQGMRQLNGVYTQAHNRRHNRVGHVFQGRFKGILVDADSYLLELSRYVVLNPLRARMVKQLRHWKWSSYPAMTGKVKAPDWLETDWILGHFGKQRKRAVKRYIEFVAQGRGLETVWDEKIHPVILGSETYVESIYRHHVDERASDIEEISRLEQRRKNKPLVDYFPEGIDRGLGIAAAYSSGYYSQKEIADYCGIHYSTVSRSLRDQGMKKS